MNPIRIGTRGSALARVQAYGIARLLRENGTEVEIIEIRTTGDVSQVEPIHGLGSTGVFTKEIQSALLRNEIDLAVHSLKDLPTESVPGLELGAVPRRASFRDVLCSREGRNLQTLPLHAKIGTGSFRRKTQLEHRFPSRFRIEEIRGNVETRLQKLADGFYDAIILAEAGLARLGLQERIATVLEPPLFLPAVGQGAIGLEIREKDFPVRSVVSRLNDPETFAAVSAERSMLKTLRGGCIAPIAALGSVESDQLVLHGRVLSLDGSRMLESTVRGSLENALQIGEKTAENLLSRGAEELIAEIRKP